MCRISSRITKVVNWLQHLNIIEITDPSWTGPNSDEVGMLFVKNLKKKIAGAYWEGYRRRQVKHRAAPMSVGKKSQGENLSGDRVDISRGGKQHQGRLPFSWAPATTFGLSSPCSQSERHFSFFFLLCDRSKSDAISVAGQENLQSSCLESGTKTNRKKGEKQHMSSTGINWNCFLLVE